MTLLYEVEIGKRGAALDVFPLAPGRIEVSLRCSDHASLDFQADLQAEMIRRWPEAQGPTSPLLEKALGVTSLVILLST